MARIALTENSFKYTQDVVNYLKAIKAAISNRPYWEIVNWSRLDLSTAEAMADEIKGNIGDNLYPHAARETNYTNRLFSVNGETVRKVRDYFYGNGDRYAKAKWLQMNNVKVVSGYGGHERFDIWIYAYDIDFNASEGPEHQVNLIKNDGTTSELGRIARNRSEAGNEIDKGFLLQNYSFEDLIGDDEELTIEVYNFPGGRSSSKLYAIAIMPHVDTTTQDDVTWYYQNDIEFIRRTSTGFVEFRKRARSSDEERFQTTIRLYAA